MIDGITYFRKNSPYQGDVTKNCALDGYEVDNNFFVLEGRDIKSVTVSGDDIVINLINGESVKAEDALKKLNEGLAQSITKIEFDQEKGILKVTQNGEIQLISGFATEMNTGVTVAADDSIIGNGTPAKPIGVSPLFKTGQFRPVKKYLDITIGEQLPCDCTKISIGDRYVTKEYVSDYGLLYDYDAVTKIACDLRDAHSPWRIPTKEDWDGMLNAVEPCQKDKNHTSATSNKWLGKWAGKLLKSTNLWAEGSSDACDCGNEGTCINYDINESSNCTSSCDETYCGKVNECNCCHDKCSTTGLDKFGFRVTPAGYADDGKNFVFFGERAYFWTATNSNCTSVYAKRFDFDRNSVYQNIIPGQNYLSLRLVKDYKGDNYIENEEILSSFYPTVLIPSENGGRSIWTSINVSFGCNCGCAIKPNNGEGLTKVVHFFVNEWDGHKWNRIELHNGDSVVVVDAPKNQKDIEYRVVNNSFIEVNSMVYDDVIEQLQPKFDALNEKIEDEINRSIAKDSLIDGVINDELKPSINKNASDIATVNTNLVTAIDKINSDIVTVNKNLVDAINTINGGIATEIQERKDADTSLQEQITANKEAIDNLDTKTSDTDSKLAHTNQVLSDFGTETAKAFEQINKVITDGFNTINGGIATEIQERKDADEKIKGTILTNEGTEFNAENGVLTLKSKDATNDIKVQFTMNFGEF